MGGSGFLSRGVRLAGRVGISNATRRGRGPGRARRPTPHLRRSRGLLFVDADAIVARRCHARARAEDAAGSAAAALIDIGPALSLAHDGPTQPKCANAESALERTDTGVRRLPGRV